MTWCAIDGWHIGRRTFVEGDPEKAASDWDWDFDDYAEAILTAALPLPDLRTAIRDKLDRIATLAAELVYEKAVEHAEEMPPIVTLGERPFLSVAIADDLWINTELLPLVALMDDLEEHVRDDGSDEPIRTYVNVLRAIADDIERRLSERQDQTKNIS